MLALLLFFPPVLGRIIHIPAEQPTIQAGINAAVDGDTVLVADGRYYENINFRGKAITVASRYLLDGDTAHIANTIIDGSRPGHADSASVVYFISGEDTTSLLYGFTITHGGGTITELWFMNTLYNGRVGGGIFCYNAGARISYNRIVNNHIANVNWALAGGVFVDTYDSLTHVILDNNRISRNTLTAIENAEGGGVYLNSHATVTNNIVSHNSSASNGYANSGGIQCWSVEFSRYVVLQNNRIRYNLVRAKNGAVGGGIQIMYATTATITGNDISYNEVNADYYCYGGGICLIYCAGSNSIIGNTITHNRANSPNRVHSRGGGIDLTFNSNQSNTLISGNVITGNRAWIGGAFHSYLSKAQLRDNTIKDNTDLLWEGTD
jgi:hypothetical protein